MSDQAAQSIQPTAKPNRYREIGAILALTFGAVLFLALVSYHPSDPSWNVAGDGTTRNLLGSLGAHLADLMFQFFGHNAYIIAGISLLFAFAMLLQRRLKLRFISIVGYLTIGLLSAGLWHLFVGKSGMHSAGGVWGQWLGETLRTQAGTIGAVILLLMCSMLAIVWTTQFSFLLAAQHTARRCEPRVTAWWLRQQEKMLDWRDNWARWRGQRSQRHSSYMPVTDSQFVVAEGLQSELPALELDGAWLDADAENSGFAGTIDARVAGFTGRHQLPELTPPERNDIYQDGVGRDSESFWDDSTPEEGESTRALQPGANAEHTISQAPSQKATSRVPLSAPEGSGASATLFDEVPYELPSKSPSQNPEIPLSCVEEQAMMLNAAALAPKQDVPVQLERHTPAHDATQDDSSLDTMPEGPIPQEDVPAHIEQTGIAAVSLSAEELEALPNSEYVEMMGFLDSMEQVASESTDTNAALEETHIEQTTLQEQPMPQHATQAHATEAHGTQAHVTQAHATQDERFHAHAVAAPPQPAPLAAPIQQPVHVSAPATQEQPAWHEPVAVETRADAIVTEHEPTYAAEEDVYDTLPPLSFAEIAAIASPEEARTLIPTHVADKKTAPPTEANDALFFEAAPAEMLTVPPSPDTLHPETVVPEMLHAPVVEAAPLANIPADVPAIQPTPVVEASVAQAVREVPAAHETPVAEVAAPVVPETPVAPPVAEVAAEVPVEEVVEKPTKRKRRKKAKKEPVVEAAKPESVVPEVVSVPAAVAPKAESVPPVANVPSAPPVQPAAPVIEAPAVQQVAAPAKVEAPVVIESVPKEAPPAPAPKLAAKETPVVEEVPAGLVGVASPTPTPVVEVDADKPVIKERAKPLSTDVVKARPQPKRRVVNYDPPSLELLDYVEPPIDEELVPEYLIKNAEILEKTLENFGVRGKVKEILPGPVITLYEYLPEPGIKVSKIANLADDLAMALHALQVRVIAPIPGKGVVGIELPNKKRENVYLREILADERFQNTQARLPLVMGKDTTGNAYVANLAKMPHLLIAGTTGSGKSVGVNAMICSLLYHHSPEDVRFLMIDPKMLELSIYDGIPHLLLPVVIDPKKAAVALAWAVQEMERRYTLMAEAGVRNIINYNRLIEKRIKMRDQRQAREAAYDQARRDAADVAPEDISWEDEDSAEFDLNDLNPEGAPLSYYEKLPYIVVIIDELADLMMVAAKEVEFSIARLAQMARAAGLHLLLATQRPSVDVLTGVIKANFPSRLAFQVKSKIDSRTILDQPGAEKLLGMGDMLLVPPGAGSPVRIHGAFVSEEEIHRIVKHLKQQGEPDYNEDILAAANVVEDEDESDADPMYDQAVEIVLKTRNASISHLQRKLRIGYNRAARIVEYMEREGLVGAQVGNKPREVLVPPPQ